MSQDLVSAAQLQGQWQWAKTETWEGPSKHQNTLFYCEGDGIMEQLDQRCCEVSILQGIQKLAGHSAGQPTLR